MGRINKAWLIEGSDKLFAEEIDIGEPEGPRQIASGLRQFYSLEEMNTGRRVLVVSNLKAKKLAGFASHGMVLCAKKDDMVEFVDPPADAKIGERIFFEGLTGEPVSAAQVAKKKVWENCAPLMHTKDDKVACWEGKPMMTSAGPCTAPRVAGGAVN